MLRRQLLCTFLLLAALRLFGCTLPRLGATSAPVVISLMPRVASAPATFRVRVVIVLDPANRSLCYGYDGPAYKRSCATLDGERSPAVYEKYWEIRSGGEYVAFADLVQSQEGRDRHVVGTQTFQVISPF